MAWLALVLAAGASRASGAILLAAPVFASASKLVASEAGKDFAFGTAMDTDGDTLVVGAAEDDALGNLSGAAYVFVRSGEGWLEQAKLAAADAEPYDELGNSVAISGDTLFAAATLAALRRHARRRPRSMRHASRRRLRICFSLPLALVLWSPTARSATELPFTDGFDTSVFGWVSTVGNVTVEWSDLDVAGSASSGSARLVNQRPDGSSGPVEWMLDCFKVSAGTPYTIGASILIPSGQTTSGVAQVVASWYASGSCTRATLLEWGRSPDIRIAGTWFRVEDSALVAPPGAEGARIGMLLFKNGATGALAAHFDDLMLAPEPGRLALGLVAAAVLAARRARERRMRR
jgi:hypothetical protein